MLRYKRVVYKRDIGYMYFFWSSFGSLAQVQPLAVIEPGFIALLLDAAVGPMCFTGKGQLHWKLRIHRTGMVPAVQKRKRFTDTMHENEGKRGMGSPEAMRFRRG